MGRVERLRNKREITMHPNKATLYGGWCPNINFVARYGARVPSSSSFRPNNRNTPSPSTANTAASSHGYFEFRWYLRPQCGPPEPDIGPQANPHRDFYNILYKIHGGI
jgi:hypothetical protein